MDAVHGSHAHQRGSPERDLMKKLFLVILTATWLAATSAPVISFGRASRVVSKYDKPGMCMDMAAMFPNVSVL